MSSSCPVTTAFLTIHPDLAAFVLALTHDPHLTEDICQEAWVRLEQQITAGRSIENVAGYCRTIAKHAIMKHWQRQGRERPSGEKIIDLLADGFEAEPPDDGERLGALRQCLQGLDEPARALLQQRYIDRRPAQSIAERIGVTLEALNMRLMRIRQALKQCVAKRLLRTSGE